jgi:hypothetical protein
VERPALSDLTSSLGASALLLLRLRVITPQLAVPVFLVNALWHTFDYVLRLLQHREADYRTSISSRLALLGNRIGFEFQQEIRRRLADLHQWREHAIRSIGEQRIKEFAA